MENFCLTIDYQCISYGVPHSRLNGFRLSLVLHRYFTLPDDVQVSLGEQDTLCSSMKGKPQFFIGKASLKTLESLKEVQLTKIEFLLVLRF